MNDLKLKESTFYVLCLASMMNVVIFIPDISISVIVISVILILFAVIYEYFADVLLTGYKNILFVDIFIELYYFGITQKTYLWNIYYMFMIIGLLLCVIYCKNRMFLLLQLGVILCVCAKIINICLAGYYFWEMREAYVVLYEIKHFLRTIAVVIIEILPVLILYVISWRNMKTCLREEDCDDIQKNC